MNTTPISLLERMRQPDQPAAWSRFVELYTPVLLTWAQRLGVKPRDAADLVQEVFTVLVCKLPEFHYNHQQSFRRWLHTVTLRLNPPSRSHSSSSLATHRGKMVTLYGKMTEKW
jgi:RNA polymerase sigma-70 factor, ECF subfamily